MKAHFQLLKKLEPIDTGESPSYDAIDDIRAVLFDVYGTLIMSSSGDIGATSLGPQNALSALEECGIRLSPERSSSDVGGRAISLFRRCVDAEHRRLRGEGIDFPEIDIVEVWRGVLRKLATEGGIQLDGELEELDFQRFATAFEMLNNPTWPMPHMEATLEAIQKKGLRLGIISNAQFFTPPLLNHFLGGENSGRDASVDGFDSDLCFFSFQHRYAKPSLHIFEEARDRLKERGIEARQTLYVGNDMLKDIYPASRVGFRTVLFAGDRRSLRLRQSDPTLAGLKPDAVITSLASIEEILSLGISQ